MRLATACLVICIVSVAAYAAPSFETDVQTDKKPYTSLDLNNDPDVFRFAIISDNSGGPRWGIFEEAVAKLNLLQPEFVITTGDMIEGYENTPEALNKQWERLVAARNKLQMPFFHVPGNHDNGRELWSQMYNERFGQPFYHFVYKDVLFLTLGTNTAEKFGTGLSRQMVDYAITTLNEHKDVRYTLVFQHKPLWNENNAEWKEIEAQLKGRPCTIFCGHTHNYMNQERDGISFITMATTGGGSSLSGVATGEFDHIVWVTMTKDGPQIANLLLDGIYAKDLRTSKQASQLGMFNFNSAITAEAIQIDTAEFQNGVSRLSIINPSDQPLRVKVLSETAAGVRVEPSTVAAIVPAQSTHEVDLKISADAPVPVAQFQPVVLHWTGNYDSENNQRSLELKGKVVIPVDAPFALAAAPKPVVVDGNLDEWADLPFVVNQPCDIYTTPSAWKGPQDGSFKFAVSHDDQYLYIAARTTDDEPMFDGWKYWEDFMMVTVDGRATKKDDEKTGIFSAAAGPKIDPAQVEEYVDNAPEGVKSASVALPDGLGAEFAIPLAWLNERQNGNWSQVRVNIAFSDFDTRDSRDGATILFWRPQWERKLDFNTCLFRKTN